MKELIMITVSSLIIHSAGYDKENKIVFIRFQKNSSLYCYFNVPYNIFNDLINSSSVGSYLTKNIKNVYQYQKLE